MVGSSKHINSGEQRKTEERQEKEMASKWQRKNHNPSQRPPHKKTTEHITLYISFVSMKKDDSIKPFDFTNQALKHSISFRDARRANYSKSSGLFFLWSFHYTITIIHTTLFFGELIKMANWCVLAISWPLLMHRKKKLNFLLE